ncbi:MAG: substrate-binding domain-containing protein [Asticcacaulis sp.]
MDKDQVMIPRRNTLSRTGGIGGKISAVVAWLARPVFPRLTVLAAAALLVSCQTAPVGAPDAELTVLTSGGFTAAWQDLEPQYELRSGNRVVTELGPSMGATPNAIPMRLDRGEPADVVILAREALDKLADKGEVIRKSETDLALSRIAMAVKSDAAVPDISTDDALRATLLKAKSVAYSDSASGVYVSTQLFQRLGIADQMAAKSRMIPATPVGQIVASGEAEIGFQQLSELKPVPGIRIVGLIPKMFRR